MAHGAGGCVLEPGTALALGFESGEVFVNLDAIFNETTGHLIVAPFAFEEVISDAVLGYADIKDVAPAALGGPASILDEGSVLYVPLAKVGLVLAIGGDGGDAGVGQGLACADRALGVNLGKACYAIPGF